MKIKTGNPWKQISETKTWFSEKINKIDTPLARIRKKERPHKLLISEIKEGTSLQIPRTVKG